MKPHTSIPTLAIHCVRNDMRKMGGSPREWPFTAGLNTLPLGMFGH